MQAFKTASECILWTTINNQFYSIALLVDRFYTRYLLCVLYYELLIPHTGSI